MTRSRPLPSQITAISLILGQALGFGWVSTNTWAQSANGAPPSLPSKVSVQSLTGIDQPQQFIAKPKTALPDQATPSYINEDRIIRVNPHNFGACLDEVRRLLTDDAYWLEKVNQPIFKRPLEEIMADIVVNLKDLLIL